MDTGAAQILAFGEAMVEFNQTGAGEGRLFLQGFGGDTSNFAIAAARLGARVHSTGHRAGISLPISASAAKPALRRSTPHAPPACRSRSAPTCA